VNKLLLADILMSIGSLIGLYNKGQALYFTETVWSRKGSLINAVTYPVTALLPMAYLEIWISFTVSLLNFFIWIGIYFYRAPEKEDWIGRNT